jgi:aspartyl-tRNA(Asn)/glutamyl-tRNA(Gln) amidotransferase subunit C
MKITKQQVEHMASLAKLELSDEEKTKRAQEFSDILGYIEKLNEVDISNVEPMTGGTDLTNKLRTDEVTKEQGEQVRKKFVPLAPEHSDEFIETISPLGGKS